MNRAWQRKLNRITTAGYIIISLFISSLSLLLSGMLFQFHYHGFGGGGIAFVGCARDGHEYIGLGKVSGGAACGNGIGYHYETMGHPPGAAGVIMDVHHIAIGEAVVLHMLTGHEDNAALIVNAAVTVVEAIDSGIKLVVATDGHHQ